MGSAKGVVGAFHLVGQTHEEEVFGRLVLKKCARCGDGFFTLLRVAFIAVAFRLGGIVGRSFGRGRLEGGSPHVLVRQKRQGREHPCAGFAAAELVRLRGKLCHPVIRPGSQRGKHDQWSVPQVQPWRGKVRAAELFAAQPVEELLQGPLDPRAVRRLQVHVSGDADIKRHSQVCGGELGRHGHVCSVGRLLRECVHGFSNPSKK